MRSLSDLLTASVKKFHCVHDECNNGTVKKLQEGIDSTFKRLFVQDNLSGRPYVSSIMESSPFPDVDAPVQHLDTWVEDGKLKKINRFFQCIAPSLALSSQFQCAPQNWQEE